MAPKQSWSEQEDVALCRAYLYHTENSTHGNNQKSNIFWDEIIATQQGFLAAEGSSYTVRTRAAVISRWKKQIIQPLNKWKAALVQVESLNASGHNLLDVHSSALANYRSTNGTHFTCMHCWEVLKDWIYFHTPDSEPEELHQHTGFNTTPGYTPIDDSTPPEDDVMEEPERVISPATNPPSSLPRPSGTKKTKKGKKKAAAGSSFEDERLRSAERMQLLMEEGRNKRHNELLQQKMLDDDRRLTKQSYDDDMKIMSMSLTDMTPARAQFFRSMQEQIAQKRVRKNLFGSSSGDATNLDDPDFNPFG